MGNPNAAANVNHADEVKRDNAVGLKIAEEAIDAAVGSLGSTGMATGVFRSGNVVVAVVVPMSHLLEQTAEERVGEGKDLKVKPGGVKSVDLDSNGVRKDLASGQGGALAEAILAAMKFAGAPADALAKKAG